MNTKNTTTTAILIHRVHELYSLAADMHERAGNLLGLGEIARGNRALRAVGRLQRAALLLLLDTLDRKTGLHVLALLDKCSKARLERLMSRMEKNGTKALLT
jgi:hypothetical protein